MTKYSKTEQRIARVAIRTSHIRQQNKNGDTDEQRRASMEDALSPQTQLEMARSYCAEHHLTLDETASLEFADLDVSGSKVAWRKRPNLAKHFEDAKLGKYHHLLFYKLARAGRNLHDTLDCLETFEKTGITLHGIRDSVDGTSANGRLVRNLLLSVAEYQAEDISSNIRDSIITRARQGKVHWNKLPMWLRYSSDGEIEVIPEMEFAMLRLVQLRLSGLGYLKIASAMNSEGLRTINGKIWREGVTRKYLTESYIQSMCGTGFLYRDKPEHDQDRVVLHGMFPRILTDDMEQAIKTVQAAYRDAPLTSSIPGAGTWQSNIAKIGRYRADSKYLAAGIVYCSVCGAKMLSMQHGNDRTNKRGYQCPNARAFPDGHRVPGHLINAESLEDGILRVIRYVLGRPPSPRRQSRIQRKPRRTAEIVQAEMDTLVRMHLRNTISQVSYDKAYTELSQEMAELQKVHAEDGYDIREAADRIMGHGGEPTQEQLRQLILLLVERVEAPIVFPDVFVRGSGTGLRRHARVLLNLDTDYAARAFTVALYQQRFTGERQAPMPTLTGPYK